MTGLLAEEFLIRGCYLSTCRASLSGNQNGTTADSSSWHLGTTLRSSALSVPSFSVDLRSVLSSRKYSAYGRKLVEPHWYEYFLHNQRGAWLKTLLFLEGKKRIVVTNNPWYLRED
jgi:hypothetical protein